MVSIVLPTYNGKNYICESIESVINQTYNDWELVIVDDCSNDGTESIINGYAKEDSRIKIIHNKVNKKLPGALNVGFSHAKGDFLSWTSDDNVYQKNAIEKMVHFLLDHPAADIVYADYDLIDGQGSIIGEVVHEATGNIYKDNIVGACFMYRREVQEKLGGYNENLFLVEDYDFWLRAYEQYTLHLLPEKLYLYRTHSNSLTDTRMAEIGAATSKVLERIIDNKDLNETNKTILLKRIISYTYNYCFDQTKFRKYMQLLKTVSPKEYKAFGIRMILCQYCSRLLMK